MGRGLGLIITIGGGFTWFGVTNNKLDHLSNVKTTVTENSKRTEINQKEIELLKLQIKEIQLKSQPTFKLIWQEMMYKVLQ